MKAIDVIRNALEFSDRGTLGLIEDMRDAALTQPTPRGGNHPLWVLGHITLVEGNIPRVIDQKPAAPPKGLEHVFGTVGATFLTIAMHQMSHRGQVADARRAAGRTPVFTPALEFGNSR